MEEQLGTTMPAEEETVETQDVETSDPVSPTEETTEVPANEFNDAEKAEIEKFMSRFKLPEGVDYYADKDGSLKFIVPINGKKFIASPEDLVKGFGLNQAGYQRLNEAKGIEKEVRDMFARIKENPRELFTLAHKLGVDPRELAAEYLQEIVEEEELSPAEREARRAKRELEEYKKEIERIRLEREQEQLNAQIADERDRYDKELVAAMTEHGFTKSNTKTKSYILSSAVGKMMLALQNGRTLTPSDAVYLAKQDWQDFVQGVYGELDSNQILSVTPKHIIEAIRKADQAGLKSKLLGTPTSSVDIGGPVDLEEVPTRKPKKTKTINEFFDNL
jgi:hypothetical protein